MNGSLYLLEDAMNSGSLLPEHFKTAISKGFNAMKSLHKQMFSHICKHVKLISVHTLGQRGERPFRTHKLAHYYCLQEQSLQL